MNNFTVLPEHIKLLQATNFGWLDCEFGGLSMDCKRPFGNSDVFGDIAEILEIKIDEQNGANDQQQEYMYQLYSDLEIVLAIMIANCSLETGTYQPYKKQSGLYGWKKI